MTPKLHPSILLLCVLGASVVPSHAQTAIPERLKQLDKNSDGTLTRNEVTDVTAFTSADSNPSPSFYGKPTTSLRDNPSFMRCLARARADLGTKGYGIGEFRFGAKDHATWHHWFTQHFANDPDCLFAALYNYDTMKGQPEIERAMLDAMKMASN